MKCAGGMLKSHHTLSRQLWLMTSRSLLGKSTQDTRRQCCNAVGDVHHMPARQAMSILFDTTKSSDGFKFARVTFSTSSASRQKSSVDELQSVVTEISDVDEDDDAAVENLGEALTATPKSELLQTSRDPKDRSREIPWELSARYLRSKAYRETYKGMLVWQPYVRNFKGQTPKETRKTCIKFQKLITNNPCPICRDEYLVVDYRNTELLNQFISPYTGKIIDRVQTQVCRRKYFLLIKEIEKGRDIGTLPHEEVHRHYDYSVYYDKDQQSSSNSSQPTNQINGYACYANGMYD